jgi:D-3-phosphoglycerate dehydrogenase
MNTPGGNNVTTAEHTVALLLAMARQVPQASASVKSGRWEKNKFSGVELYNKTLGVIGLGQIGGYVAKLAQGLMMHVIGYDPFLSPENAAKLGVELVDLSELYRRSDFISLHVPLTAETKYLIRSETIAQMKDGVRIINCARGGVVQEQDLYEALLKKKVAAAALDVFEKEPVDPKNPLLTLENVIYTPHIGAATNEAQENVALAVAEQVVDYLVKGIVRNAVNIPSIPGELLPVIQPYLTLAGKLGAFLAQIYEGGLEAVTLEYKGEVANLSVAPMSVAVLKGLLNPILEEPINEVNAPVVAKERGIEVKEVRSTDAGNFSSLIVLKVKSGGKTTSVAGSLYNKREPRIVSIDGLSLEVIPEGSMLMLTNDDKPGVIGQLGTLLGDNEVNVARMQLGRERPGGKAISVVGIDAPASHELLAKIKRLPHVLSVKQIRL